MEMTYIERVLTNLYDPTVLTEQFLHPQQCSLVHYTVIWDLNRFSEVMPALLD